MDLVKLARWVQARMSPDCWSIGIIPAPIHTLIYAAPSTIFWLPELGANTYLADPFGFEQDGRRTILLEKYSYLTGRGELVQLDLASASGLQVRPVTGMQGLNH